MPRKKKKNQLSPLENEVMNVIWERQTATAEDVRGALSRKSRPMKDSTVRTILRRLEDKGYVTHEVAGRTYLYSAAIASQSVATDAVKGIIERFCGGSVEDLLVGLVNDEVVSADTLKTLAQRIAKSEQRRKRGEGE